jgi:molybdopterin-containing oxidoreductase family membrane subunit
MANLARLVLAAALMLAYFYVVELLMAWYTGDRFDRYVHLVQRPLGDYAPLYWLMLLLNVVVPQVLWSRQLRTRTGVLLGVGIAVLAGMWLERYLIIVTSLSRDYLPSSWATFAPTWVDLGLLTGTVGLFLLLFLLFLRFVPGVSLHEMRHLVRQLDRAPERRDA